MATLILNLHLHIWSIKWVLSWPENQQVRGSKSIKRGISSDMSSYLQYVYTHICIRIFIRPAFVKTSFQKHAQQHSSFYLPFCVCVWKSFWYHFPSWDKRWGSINEMGFSKKQNNGLHFWGFLWNKIKPCGTQTSAFVSYGWNEEPKECGFWKSYPKNFRSFH